MYLQRMIDFSIWREPRDAIVVIILVSCSRFSHGLSPSVERATKKTAIVDASHVAALCSSWSSLENNRKSASPASHISFSPPFLLQSDRCHNYCPCWSPSVKVVWRGAGLSFSNMRSFAINPVLSEIIWPTKGKNSH